MKELKIMKALRYLLIVMMLSVASLAFATAQSLAQQPEAQMQSTSIIAGSGSQLPSAAVQGTYVTGATVGTYSPANASGPNRAKRGDDDWEDDDWGDTGDPYPTPLGDAAWLLLALAAAYAVLRVYMRSSEIVNKRK